MSQQKAAHDYSYVPTMNIQRESPSLGDRLEPLFSEELAGQVRRNESINRRKRAAKSMDFDPDAKNDKHFVKQDG
jgi:hypothetical protein